MKLMTLIFVAALSISASAKKTKLPFTYKVDSVQSVIYKALTEANKNEFYPNSYIFSSSSSHVHRRFLVNVPTIKATSNEDYIECAGVSFSTGTLNIPEYMCEFSNTFFDYDDKSSSIQSILFYSLLILEASDLNNACSDKCVKVVNETDFAVELRVDDDKSSLICGSRMFSNKDYYECELTVLD